MPQRTQALYALTATMLIWGFTPVATRFLARDLPPGDVVVIRYFFCALAFAVLLTVIRGWSCRLADLPRFIGCALTGVAGYNITNIFGFQTTPASLGGLILGTEPAIIAVLAAVLLGEALTLPVVAGLVLASLGTFVLFAGDLAMEAAQPAGIVGPLLVLISAIAWSLYVVLIKPLLIAYGPVRASALVSMIGSPMIMLLGREETLATAAGMTVAQWAVLGFLAVLGTVVSLFLWNFGNRYVTSASAGAFIYAVPLISLVTAVLILGEPLTLPIVIGGVLILGGVAVAQLRPRAGSTAGPKTAS